MQHTPPTPDPFENDLRALQRRALPADWREEILLAAATKSAPRPHRTRWMVAGLGLAWAAILVMAFTMPAEPALQQSTAHTPSGTPPLLWQQRAAAIEALLAAN